MKQVRILVGANTGKIYPVIEELSDGVKVYGDLINSDKQGNLVYLYSEVEFINE